MKKEKFKPLGCFQFKAITNEGTSARYRVAVYDEAIVVHKVFMYPNREHGVEGLEVLRQSDKYILYKQTVSFKAPSLATILFGAKGIYEANNIKFTQTPTPDA